VYSRLGLFIEVMLLSLKPISMQQFVLKHIYKLLMVSVLLLNGLVVKAQEKIDIDIDKEEVGSWLERNWIWVAGGVVLLLLIALLGRSNRRTRRDDVVEAGTRKTTTVIKDADGNTRSITTQEEKL
jgi:hypothetical protein